MSSDAMSDVPQAADPPAAATASAPAPAPAAATMTDAAPAASPKPAAAASNGVAAPSSPAKAAAPSASGAAPNGTPAKKVIMLKKPTTAPTAATPVPIGSKPKPIGAPAATGPKPIGAPKPIAAAAGGAAKPAAAASASAPKKLVKKEAAESSSSSSSDSSSSDDDSSEDELLVNTPKKNATVKAPPAAAAASSSAAAAVVKKEPVKRTPAKKPEKRKAESSSDDDSSSSSEDSSEDSSDSSDSDSSSDSSDSDDSAPKKRKPAAKKAAAKKPAAKKGKGAGGSSTKYSSKSGAPKRPKADGESSGSDQEEEGYDESKVILYPMDKYIVRADIQPLKETQGANKWWNRMRAPGDKTKWTSLEHNGILFPAEYVAHKVPVYYEEKAVELTIEQEEVASMWALMPEQYTAQATFRKNFFRDWKALFPKDSIIKDLNKCDFTVMTKHLTTERDTAKLIKKSDSAARAREKAEKDRLQEIYGFALVDGFKEKVGNYRVEPPNLFRGRGDHPKTGTLKRRVKPEDIIINIGPNTPIPPPPAGHKWKGIIHNNKVTWLAFYRDNVNGDFKYIWLAPSSRFKGESDVKKYTKAQKLKTYISEIRKNYKKEMRSEHSQFRQRATAIYLIDELALRVGNEKDKNEVADTVGCCSLRVEHLKFDPPRTVTFDFLGKDSMRYLNTVALDQTAYDNLKSFTVGKKPKEEIFDGLSTTLLNEHLKSLMPELTAKVFRTYNASVTLEKELYKEGADIDASEHLNSKKNFYNAANREVAILCNHQRSIPKGFDSAIAKMKENMDALEDDREELEDWIEEFQEKKTNKAAQKLRQEREEQRATRRAARLGKWRGEAKVKKDKEKEDRAKLRAAGKTVPDSESEDETYGVPDKTKNKPADLNRAEAQLKKLLERIANHAAQLALKDQSKDVALGTAKINYMDPRITVAWCKAKEVPLEAVFNKSLVTKFPWAMEVPSTWRF